MTDLFVLAADLDMAETMRALLNRHEDLGIRQIGSSVDKHREHDPGCRSDPVTPLRPYIGRYDELRTWLGRRGLWEAAMARPQNPKEAYRAALREGRKRPSAALFGELAANVPLRRCRCPAFNELRRTLQGWFPPEDVHE